MNPRISEIVRELDKALPLEGADAIVFTDFFWQVFPSVERHRHYTAFLATPTGFARFGLEFLKAAISTRAEKGTRGDSVPVELDYLLRPDSNVEFLCERLAATPERGAPQAGGATRDFDWESAKSFDAAAWIPLLEELDHLVPIVDAEVTIKVAENTLSEIAVSGTEAGLLRFGLEFAKGSVVPASKKGRNRGQRLSLDLDYLVRAESELEFDCERVAALPRKGDRRRPKEIPGLVILAFIAVGIVALVRGC